MLFSFCILSAFALALFSFVSANPLPTMLRGRLVDASRSQLRLCPSTGQVIVALIEDAPISGYYLGVGRHNTVILSPELTGYFDTSTDDGGIGFWSNCKERWLNYAEDDASAGTQSLIWGSKGNPFSWSGTPGQSTIYNFDYRTEIFQVCQGELGEWVVSLVTQSAATDAACYFTKLQILGA